MEPEPNPNKLSGNTAKAENTITTASAPKQNHDVVTLLLGALIGFFPAAIQLYLQASIHKDEMLLQQRIAAVSQYSQAVHTYVAQVRVAIDFARYTTDHVDLTQPFGKYAAELRPAFDGLAKALQHDSLAQANTQIFAINALFNESIPTIETSQWFDLKPSVPKDSLRSRIIEELNRLSDWNNKLDSNSRSHTPRLMKHLYSTIHR